MPRYEVKAPLNHDLKEYLPGDAVEMTEAQAAALQAVEVVGEGISGEVSDGELIEKIKTAGTIDEITVLVGKIRRKAIVDAADARTAELQSKA